VVVIVDDTETVASSLALAFENIPDVKSVIMHNPMAALRLFTAPGSRIAAVVTDFNLPHLDGFELIRQIRKMDKYHNLPAIMITADERAADAARSKEHTPNAIFRKPCSLREVCRVLEELLQ
jgi:CheY-like chemotaxis protein